MAEQIRYNEGAVRCSKPPGGAHYPMHLAGPTEGYHFEYGGEIDNQSWVALDFDSIASTSSASDFALSRFWEDVETILDRAVEGKLSFSDNPNNRRDVTPIKKENHLHLLELRLPTPLRFPDAKSSEGRIYAWEPREGLYTGIVILLLHVKEMYSETIHIDRQAYLDSSREEQNGYIIEAGKRCRTTKQHLSIPF